MFRLPPSLRFAALLCLLAPSLLPQATRAYYRFPAIYKDKVVFVAEGDLWETTVQGGIARRLTTHPAEETSPRFSPDGNTLAFTASYEGAPDAYTMPATGGLPKRRSFGGGAVRAWSPDGKLLVSTSAYSGIPDPQLVTIDGDSNIDRVPLHQALQGVYSDNGKTIFFARRPQNSSVAKRYKGGQAQTLWKWSVGAEAVALTADYPGTSSDPLYWRGRVYFVTDRDGSMNLWSMDENGKGLRQHTKHTGFDVKSPNLHEGRIVYQLATDLHVFDIATSQDKKLDIQIASDFEHLRERWITKPLEFLTSANLSHDGSRIAFTTRGRVFSVPAKTGRLVEATPPKARYRDGQLLPDGKSLLTLSSESGELEWYKLPANGVGAGERLTNDGNVLRWGAKVSPDGVYAAHSDKNNNLWLLNLNTKEQKKIVTGNPTTNSSPAFDDLAWSPDSRWLAYSTEAANTFDQIWLYSVADASLTALTTNRYNSGSPAWSADGKWIYFLSDRSLRTTVGSPWGPRAPDPNFDRSFKIYQVPLQKDLRSPFEPADETQAAEPAKKPEAPKADAKVTVAIDLAGITTRLMEVPAPAGNYRSLTAPGKRLCFINGDRSDFTKTALQCLDVANKGEKPETVFEGLRAYQLSGDSSKMMIVRGDEYFVVDATAKAPALLGKPLADARVNLAGWTFSVLPQEEFREALNDAWRLHRDYFYDRNMHGVNWKLMKDKYGELVGRVRDRSELSDLLAQMISELNVLHNSVRGGDLREAPDQIRFGTLGARLLRDAAAGGWRIDHIYRHDPDRPDRASPLAMPNVNVSDGDILLSINGHDVLAATHPHELLRNQAGKPVLLRLKSGSAAPRDVVVKALSTQADFDLRYHEWEYTRRLEVEKATNGRMGYIHLRAMGPGDINQWAEEYYPVFDREGLIIDVRHNNGGNIDSWILGKLMRKVWMYWQPRVGNTRWNMNFAFRGPIVVLVDERTASDGEAFADGFRRLGLGKVIGTRTWGGEVWLTSSNTLADSGVATAAEIGVYGPEREWLIEGHGVDPDIIVDNLPHATFKGKDAQLEAAIQHLEQLIKLKPNPVPKVPAYPDKSK